jgi:hypothetical protein
MTFLPIQPLEIPKTREQLLPLLGEGQGEGGASLKILQPVRPFTFAAYTFHFLTGTGTKPLTRG